MQTLKERRDAIDRAAVLDALAANGSVNAAARALRTSWRRCYELMQRHSIPAPNGNGRDWRCRASRVSRNEQRVNPTIE